MNFEKISRQQKCFEKLPSMQRVNTTSSMPPCKRSIQDIVESIVKVFNKPKKHVIVFNRNIGRVKYFTI